MLARAPALCFSRKLLCFRFSRSLKAIRRQWVRFGLSFTGVNIIKMIFVFKLRLHEGRRSPAIIWLCLWFSSICFGEISQNFHSFVKIFLLIIYEPKKIGVTKVVSSLFAILCFLSLSQIWPYDFSYQQALGRPQICLTVQQMLGNSTQRNVINLIPKIPVFFVQSST